MCVIVDANRLAVTFASSDDPSAICVRNWIEKGKGKIVYSNVGRLALELSRVTEARRFVLELQRRGQARLIDGALVASAIQRLPPKGVRSNDRHILGLALASGARLLFSGDDNLVQDFTNTKIIRPRGKVFKDAKKHRHLLSNDLCP